MSTLPKRRLLVVEADALVAGTLAGILLKLGHEVTAVIDNGEDALQYVSKNVPDLMVIGVDLRGQLDGPETARLLRDRVPRPVLFLAGGVNAPLLRRMKDACPYGCIFKPLHEESIHVQLELALHRWHMEQETANLSPARAAAHANLRRVDALLPICAGCKKIHENDGRWIGLEQYFTRVAKIEFTHGFCPDCANRLYGTSGPK